MAKKPIKKVPKKRGQVPKHEKAKFKVSAGTTKINLVNGVEPA